MSNMNFNEYFLASVQGQKRGAGGAWSQNTMGFRRVRVFCFQKLNYLFLLIYC